MNTRGFSLLELVASLLMLSLSGVATLQLFTVAANLETKTQKARVNAMTMDRLKRPLALAFWEYWTRLCREGAAPPPTEISLARLVNGPVSEELAPAGGRIRAALDSLITLHGERAAEHCADEPSLAGFQTLCRCTVAASPFGTLQPAMRDLSEKHFLYSCVLVGQTLLELSTAWMNLDGTFQTCRSLRPSDGVSRFDYRMQPVEEGAPFSGSYWMEGA